MFYLYYTALMNNIVHWKEFRVFTLQFLNYLEKNISETSSFLLLLLFLGIREEDYFNNF